MTHKATIGTISRGTLKNEDLLGAFANELERLQSDRSDVAETRAVLTLHRNGWTQIMDSDEAYELLDALIEALDDFAPPYCYFGAREGDGSDFGFWPDMDAIEELPRVNDSNEVDGMGGDCVFVNDHGNVTVYGADGNVIWDVV